MQLHAPGGEHLVEDLPTGSALPRPHTRVRRRAALLLFILAVVGYIGTVMSSSAARGWLLAAASGEYISMAPRRDEFRAQAPRMADGYVLDKGPLAYRWYLPNAPQSVSAPKVDEESEEKNLSPYAAWIKRNKLHRTEPESAEAPRSRFARGRDVLERWWQRIRGK
jgi:hypothetical protein